MREEKLAVKITSFFPFSIDTPNFNVERLPRSVVKGMQRGHFSENAFQVNSSPSHRTLHLCESQSFGSLKIPVILTLNVTFDH